MNAIRTTFKGRSIQLLSRKALVLRILAIVALAILVAVRWDRISDAYVSIALTIAAIASGQAGAPGLWRWEHVQFWIASTVLVGMLYVAVRSLWPTQHSAEAAARSSHVLQLVRTSLSSSKGTAVLLVMLGIGLLSPLLAPNDPLEQGDLSVNRLRPPLSVGWYHRESASPSGANAETMLAQLYAVNQRLARFVSEDPSTMDIQSTHLFLLGSDAVGRDVLSRTVIGTRTSLALGIIAAFGAMLLGTLVGIAASLGSSITGRVMTWVTDVFLAIPSIFLVIALAFFVGGSLWGLISVLILSGWMRTARIVRGEIVHLREHEFIIAARLLGASRKKLIARHILPNLLPVLVTSTVLLVSEMLLAEAALGFLGFGVQPPLPSWGNMLGEAIAHLERSWWIAAAPGTCLTAFVLALHHAADRLDEATRL